MNRILFTLAYVASCLALCLGIVSCASQAQLDAGHELAAVVVAATDPASPGGADVTPEEKAAIAASYARLSGAPGVNWTTVGVSVAGALGAAFPALRYILPLIPNRHLIGADEAAALDKLAGTGKTPS